MTGIIDAHVHLWDREHFDYAWLEHATDLPAVHSPEDLFAGEDRREPFVFVQADVARDQGVDEARWVQSLASHAPVAGIVAFAPVEDADCESVLDSLCELPRVVGVRRLLQDESVDFFESTDLRKGLAAVAQRELTFDACVRSYQLSALAELVGGIDELTVVLDHLGKPSLGPDRLAFDAWLHDLRVIASFPRTFVKLSGLPAEASDGGQVIDYGPWLRAAVDLFGPERCVLGSDWPVSARGGSTRQQWFECVRRETGVNADEWDDIARNTAIRAYRLEYDSDQNG